MSAIPLTSGCSDLTSAESGVELGEITVENGDDAPHEIHVVVERESELVYGTARELEGVSAPEDDDFGSVDGAVLEDTAWDGTATEWTIHTRVDDRTSWNRHEIPTDDGTDCHAVRLKIEDDASVTSFTPDCDSWPPDEDR